MRNDQGSTEEEMSSEEEVMIRQDMLPGASYCEVEVQHGDVGHLDPEAGSVAGDRWPVCLSYRPWPQCGLDASKCSLRLGQDLGAADKPSYCHDRLPQPQTSCTLLLFEAELQVVEQKRRSGRLTCS